MLITITYFFKSLNILLTFLSWKCNYYYKTKCPAIVIVDEITECFESQHEHQHDPAKAPKKDEKREKPNIIITDIN